ncbi:MAG TPA: hypothetical protein VK663_01975 [Burkholderiales bacterium]|nr:hypothetical protein [Burkholderiales bacterium]
MIENLIRVGLRMKFLQPMKPFASIFFVTIFALAAANAANPEIPHYVVTLETPGFIVTISSYCGDGYVTCDNVMYRGVSKVTKAETV